MLECESFLLGERGPFGGPFSASYLGPFHDLRGSFLSKEQCFSVPLLGLERPFSVIGTVSWGVESFGSHRTDPF